MICVFHSNKYIHPSIPHSVCSEIRDSFFSTRASNIHWTHWFLAIDKQFKRTDPMLFRRESGVFFCFGLIYLNKEMRKIVEFKVNRIFDKELLFLWAQTFLRWNRPHVTPIVSYILVHIFAFCFVLSDLIQVSEKARNPYCIVPSLVTYFCMLFYIFPINVNTFKI